MSQAEQTAAALLGLELKCGTCVHSGLRHVSEAVGWKAVCTEDGLVEIDLDRRPCSRYKVINIEGIRQQMDWEDES